LQRSPQKKWRLGKGGGKKKAPEEGIGVDWVFGKFLIQIVIKREGTLAKKKESFNLDWCKREMGNKKERLHERRRNSKLSNYLGRNYCRKLSDGI